MEPDHVGQVNLGQDIAVEYDHGLGQVVPGEADGTTRAQGFRLHDVADADASVGPVAEDLLDQVGTVVEAEPHLVDLGHALQAIELIVQKRPVKDRNDGFGNLEGEGAEPCAHAACEEDRLHARRS